MKFSELKTHLEGLTRQQSIALSLSAGVPLSTVAKLRKGPTKNPRMETVEKLITAIAKKPRKAKATA